MKYFSDLPHPDSLRDLSERVKLEAEMLRYQALGLDADAALQVARASAQAIEQAYRENGPPPPNYEYTPHVEYVLNEATLAHAVTTNATVTFTVTVKLEPIRGSILRPFAPND